MQIERFLSSILKTDFSPVKNFEIIKIILSGIYFNPMKKQDALDYYSDYLIALCESRDCA